MKNLKPVRNKISEFKVDKLLSGLKKEQKKVKKKKINFSQRFFDWAQNN